MLSFKQSMNELSVLKPITVSNAEAAALPLTAITAWEMLFDRFQISETDVGSVF